jgi:alkylation response protein AidB-like acyl-CoA dehydrogenase
VTGAAQSSAGGRPGVAAGADLDGALTRIAAGASARDAVAAPGPFPAEAFALLRDCGALAATAVTGTARPPAADELALVRQVAGADGSVGRIFDGHVNAVERLAVQAPGAVGDRELTRVRAGESLLGVWGGEPIPGEGPPAELRRGRHGEVLRGVKTFCSGAGGIQRALVLARDTDADPKTGPALVLVDVEDRERVAIDTGWYRARGLIASASHRVVFHDAPVLARLGAPGSITVQPWFARDALRTAASWAGMADTAVAAALTGLRARPRNGDLEALAAGRILTAQRTIDVWLAAASAAMDDSAADLAQIALHGRAAIAESCRTLLDEAARACGSHPFATAGTLDRARRDLQLFLMQHRLEPMLARAGAAALAPGDGR